MPPLDYFPTINASLNALTAVWLVTGYTFIRKKCIAAHRACMIAASVTAVTFLSSYIYYHAHAGLNRFPGTGWPRALYLGILLTHTALAVTIVPLAAVTLTLGLRDRRAPHRRIARWTLPIWLYVSVTGVVVYWMLYRMTW
jgi:putative membrane protein